MPGKRRGPGLGHRTNNATRQRLKRAQRTEEQIEKDKATARATMALLRESEPEELRAQRNEKRKLEQRQARRKKAMRLAEESTYYTNPPLQILKIESLNIEQAQSLGLPLIENAADSEHSHSVQSYEDALRLLKPIEEFVLLEENYRAIGLVTQLEKILESSAKEAPNADASI